MILKGYILSMAYAMICLLLSFILYKLGLPKKYTRKVVHILVGFEWVILYHYMGAGVHFLAVCLIFLLILSIAYRGRLMPMISSEGDNAPGTVYYAVAMTGVAAVGCFIPEIMLPFGIGVMCTSVGDGLAGVVGQSITKYNPKVYASKTLFGTLTNLLASTFSAYAISKIYSLGLGLSECMAIGVLALGLELITPFGLDNISVTWATTALAYSFMYFEYTQHYVLPIILTPLIIAFALSKKALTKDGIVAAILLDIAVSLAFGNEGFVVLCTFFLGSVIVDKIKKHHKKQGRNSDSSDRDCRNYMQVIANGMVAFVSAISYFVTGNAIFVIPFVASLAEAFADTVASGIGVFSKTAFDPFRWRKCKKGLSGGMSLEGTFASLVAACTVSAIAYAIGFVGFGVRELIIVAASAFFGGVFDSLLGSLVQVKYKCEMCGEITEREEHCQTPTVRHSGIPNIDNDVVNILSCAVASVLATCLAILL